MDSEVDVSRLRRRVLSYIDDGRWYSPADIAASLEAPASIVTSILKHAIANGRPRVRAHWETSKGRYRLISASEKVVSLGVLTDELTPIIKVLREQGTRRIETISIGDVAAMAARLQTLLNRWAE